MGNTHGIQPDIMFVDIQMPAMNGPDLMWTMVERDVDCIIVLVSGLDQETCDIAEQLARMRRACAAPIWQA
jgi:FixJ family two-component response regulator